MKFTFPKHEKLTQQSIIDLIFKKDSPIVDEQFVYPFRILSMNQTEKGQPPKILISVSKRTFKKAVDRNLIKRRIREAYRLNKPEFLNKTVGNLPEYIVFTYIGKKIEDFKLIHEKMQKSLEILSRTEK